MSNMRSQRHRPAFAGGLAFALVLALGLLAGCQSDPGAPSPAEAGAVAGANGAGVNGAGVDGVGVGIGSIAPGAVDPQVAAIAALTRVGDRVLFATDGYDIAPESEQVLRGQAALLQEYPVVSVTIEGHADERGTREYNLALADRRAQAVRNYLVALGVAEGRIETVSFGKERPDCAEASEDCWARNRRGVTVVNQ